MIDEDDLHQGPGTGAGADRQVHQADRRDRQGQRSGNPGRLSVAPDLHNPTAARALPRDHPHPVPCRHHHGRQRAVGASPRAATAWRVTRPAPTTCAGCCAPCADFGIKVLTVYAFSTENWGRPPDEVAGLMTHPRSGHPPGDRRTCTRTGCASATAAGSRALRRRLAQQIQDAVALTCNNTRITLNVAFNYGGRAEIVDAVQHILRDGLPAGGCDRGPDLRLPLHRRPARSRPDHPHRRRVPA